MFSSAKQKVYVIHGHGGNALQMTEICGAVAKAKLPVVNFAYHSLSIDIDIVANRLIDKILKDNADTISFVTFSMGALVVRLLMGKVQDKINFPVIHQCIMIAPPNNGTKVADKYYPFRLVRFFAGPNLLKLTKEYHQKHILPKPTCRTIVVFGIKGDKKGYNSYLKSDNDGYLIPEESLIGVEEKVVLVKSSHNKLPRKKEVLNLITRYLSAE